MSGTGFDAQAFLRQLTEQPGVYRFMAGDDIVYIGKARNLKRRVASYFRSHGLAPKTEAMLALATRVEVTVCASEDEALILEARLIRKHRPRFNIMFRDDKSYPYLHLSEHEFPQLQLRRTLRQRGSGQWFGPYPSSGAVRETLQSLYRIFRLRECSDSFFAHRSRPCLQYQIQRCSAPCVGYISSDDYAQSVASAVDLLKGRSESLIRELNQRMNEAAAQLAFERAAEYKRQLAAISRLQSQAGFDRKSSLDIIAAGRSQGLTGVVVMSIRDGGISGHRSYFPQGPADAPMAEVVSAFLGQHYLNLPVPAELVLEDAPEDGAVLESALGGQAGHRVRLRVPRRGQKLAWLQLAQQTLTQALGGELALRGGDAARLQALQEALRLPAPPGRMECFDISHTGGELAVASCVVFQAGAPQRSAYRRFNIAGITPGDDYAAIHQAVSRRLAHLARGEGARPDVIFIDGGRGQLKQALKAIPAGLEQPPLLVAVAKGEGRKPGLETLLLPPSGTPLILPADSPALHLVQHIRDESHRWALLGHRGRRGRARKQSELEQIEGLGPQRRRALLRKFGGVRQIAAADVGQLRKVQGISSGLAHRIHDHFNLA